MVSPLRRLAEQLLSRPVKAPDAIDRVQIDPALLFLKPARLAYPEIKAQVFGRKTLHARYQRVQRRQLIIVSQRDVSIDLSRLQRIHCAPDLIN